MKKVSAIEMHIGEAFGYRESISAIESFSHRYALKRVWIMRGTEMHWRGFRLWKYILKCLGYKNALEVDFVGRHTLERDLA